MASLFQRLFGSTPTPPPPVAAKAVTGPGAFSMEINVPLVSLSRTPQARARQAMEVYRTNEWVHAAESLIGDKFATTTWHLEDRDGNTVPEDSTNPIHQAIRKVIRNPNPVWTRSQMWRLTSRHMGLPGRAFWYLDALDTETGIPQAIYIIPPDRMYTATDSMGNLLGWIMDADRPNGREPVPFALDEIIQFPLEPPDTGYLGVGMVEAAWNKVLLTHHTTEYANMLLASGGRIPGLMFPGEGVTFTPEQWDGFVRAIRESTTGTRRMSALQKRVEYVRTAESPESLKLPDLMTLSREDVLAIWKVPKSQLGMEGAAGLNSGERNKYDEAALWQNAVEPRIGTFVELVQYRLLNRHGLVLVVETPTFDDDVPLYEIIANARYAPVTVDEKRAVLGQDPLDPNIYGDLGTRVFIDQALSQVWPPAVTPPPPPDEPNMPPPPGDSGARTDAESLPETDISSKARLHFAALRSRIESRYEAPLRRVVAQTLAAQLEDVVRRVVTKADHLASKPNDTSVWWNAEREDARLTAALEPVLLQVASEVARTTSATFFVPPPGKAQTLVERILDLVRKSVGLRITGINVHTRDTIRDIIAANIGKSPAELGDIIEESAPFGEYRSELIARTETMLTYNEAALGTYREFDVTQVVAMDGDEDAECARRNGETFALDDAMSITDHPNGTLDWVPVVS